MMMLRFLHSFQVFLELFCYYKSYISLTCVNVSRFFVFSPECAPVSSSFFENNRSHRECLAFTRQGNKAPPSYLPRKKRHQSSLLLPPFQKRTNPAQPSVSGWAATDPRPPSVGGLFSESALLLLLLHTVVDRGRESHIVRPIYFL